MLVPGLQEARRHSAHIHADIVPRATIQNPPCRLQGSAAVAAAAAAAAATAAARPCI